MLVYMYDTDNISIYILSHVVNSENFVSLLYVLLGSYLLWLGWMSLRESRSSFIHHPIN